MKHIKVVHLGEVRSLLSEWEQVRAAMASGGVTGFHVAICKADKTETLYIGGSYKLDKEAALRVSLKASAIRMTDDEAEIDELLGHPEFKVSQL